MIVDTFLYAGERDFVDLRMCELKDKVDLFVAVEGTLTFQGERREIDTSLNHIPNLTHLVVDDFPNASKNNAWKREMWQRNAILRALRGLYDDDVIMVSDVDEIPDVNQVPVTLVPLEFYRFHQQLYQFTFNTRVRNDTGAYLGWNNTTVCRLDDLRRLYPQGVRNLTDGVFIIEGGWHFSWMHNPTDKMNAYSHVELLAMDGTIRERVKGRWKYEYEYVRGHAHLPRCVQENLERYAKYFEKGEV